MSQSVEHDHPSAFDFLRADIKNVDEFWARRGATTLGLRRTFEFVVAEKVIIPGGTPVADETDAALREALTTLIELKQTTTDQEADEWPPSSSSTLPQAAGKHSKTSGSSTVLSRADIQKLDEERAKSGATGHDEQLEDAVFMRSYIPRTLNEVYDPERDAAKVSRGEGADLIYGDITGVVAANKTVAGREGAGSTKGVHFTADVDDNGDGEGTDEDDDEDGSDDDDEGGGEKDLSKKPPRGHRHEDKDAKKVCSRNSLMNAYACWLILDI